MKIGFAGRWDPRDKKAWSGIYYYTHRQLQKYGNVEVFQFGYPYWLKNYLINVYKNPHKWFYGKQTAVEFLKPYAAYYSRKLEKELIKRKVDILFAPAAPQLIAYLTTDIPVVFMTDATFYQIQGYYDTWENFSSFNIRQGVELDQRAFQKAAHCLVASEWCKQSAVFDYGITGEKVTIAPFGANLDCIPSTGEINFNRHSLHLLFLGVEWKRKGGDIALSAFRKLKQKNNKATLHIIGCTPPSPISDEGITVIPFLDKNNKDDFQKLHQVLLNTDFLLLPTRAEAAGIVFCEASAYGIPSITVNTGGVPTYVQDHQNGYLLPPDAGGNAYADVIEKIYSDKVELTRLRYSSRRCFEERLNWESWGGSFASVLHQLFIQK
jgi:glycosyltransferase involved in cell wall biosynthesis